MADPNEIWQERIGRREKLREERRAHEKRLHDESLQGTPRYARAMQTANQIMSLMRDYIPEACVEKAYDEIVLNVFTQDCVLMAVPPEFDPLNRMSLEKAMAEMMLKPPFIPVGAGK